MQPEHRGGIGTGLVRWRFARPQSRILRIRMRVLIDSGTGSRLFDDQARARRFQLFGWLPANPDSDASLVIFRKRAGTLYWRALGKQIGRASCRERVCTSV